MLAVSSIAETSKYVFFSKVGEVIKNFLLCHSSSQIGEYIVDGDSHASYARLSAPLIRLNCDSVFVVHIEILAQPVTVEQSNGWMTGPQQNARYNYASWLCGSVPIMC
jgi:hypothetical protein